jgi:uncharacterized lipoprotein YajG
LLAIPKTPVKHSAKAKTPICARSPTLSASNPPQTLPAPNPVMKEATIVVAAKTSAPLKIASMRCQIT